MSMFGSECEISHKYASWESMFDLTKDKIVIKTIDITISNNPIFF